MKKTVDITNPKIARILKLTPQPTSSQDVVHDRYLVSTVDGEFYEVTIKARPSVAWTGLSALPRVTSVKLSDDLSGSKHRGVETTNKLLNGLFR